MADESGVVNGGGAADRAGTAPAGGGDRDAWTVSVEGFAAWLAEFSPYHRALRSDVVVHPDAPARLGAFWTVVGWAPGVGLSSWLRDGAPQRPERESGRAKATTVFRRWLGSDCFAPTLKLAEPTVAALWSRLPRRCWVQHASVTARGSCHGGWLYFVDEDAGDDPPMMVWDTSGVTHVRPQAVAAQPIGSSAVAVLIDWTVRGQANQRSSSVALPAPAEPGPFAAVYPQLWQLGPGVWGIPHGSGRTDVIGTVLYRSPRAYLEHLLAQPAQQLVGYLPGGFDVAGARTLVVDDAKALAPNRLAEHGSYVAHGHVACAVGRVGGVPVSVKRVLRGGRASGDEIFVAPEDYPVLRQILQRERIRPYQNLPPRRVPSASEPTQAERALAARLAAQAAGRPAARPRPSRPQAAVTLTVDPGVEAAVREQGALLRQRLLAAVPGLELTPPAFAADEPALVRTLWEALGYDDELRALVGWPDRASSQAALAEVLDDYRSRQAPLTRSKLPSACRLVEVDDQGCGIAVTDESRPCADPPILDVSADTARSRREHPSYVTWVVRRLADFAADRGESHCVVEFDPPLVGAVPTAPAPIPSGEPVPAGRGRRARHRPPLRSRRLGPAVWADPADEDGRWWRVGARRLSDVITWLATTGTVERFALREQPHPAAWMWLTGFTQPAELRTCDAPSGPGRYHVGTIDGITILINTAGRQAILYTSREDGEQARALAVARGWATPNARVQI